MLKRIPISSNDFGLFDAELNSYEYEYFCKHIGAFKRFMQEEPREQRQLFLDAFCEYSYNHIEIKAIASMSDPKKKFIESFRQYTQETFINGKFSAAKQFLNDSVIVARNKHMIQYMDSHSYAKDPFFHKETRDVFRRLFGEPTEAGTCVKVICVLPLYVRFAGSICRYLKKWLDVEESLYPMPVKGKKSKAEKKAMKEQALAIAKASSQHPRPTVSSPKIASTSRQNMGAVGNAKTRTGLHMISTVGSSKIIDDDGQSRALVLKSDSKAAKAEPESSEDFSNFYYDMHERKQRKRDFRKKGKKFEPIACQHPCHGKVCNCNPHKHNHTHAHDHAHDHHDQPQASREELMSCLCEKHKALAEAKIAEKRAALDKHLQNEEKKSGDKSSDGDKSPGDENPEDKSSGVKPPENKVPEAESSQVENSEGKICDDKNSEGKNSEEVNPDGITSESTCSEKKSPEDTNSGDQNSENRSSVGKISGGEKPEYKSSEDKNLEERKSLEEGTNLEGCLNLEEGKNSEQDKNLEECKTAESKEPEGSEKSEDSAAKEPEVKSPRGKKPHKRIRENGLVSSDDSSDCDAAVERFVRKTFPELLLGEDHPNQQYEKIVADEKARRQKLKENKLRTCSFCRKQETEMKSFKKCQKCKGRGTKFYCSRDCQKMDWTKHRLEH